MARQLRLSEAETRGIWVAATIHDIGKTAVPSDILTKPGALNAAEFELITAHPQLGYDIVAAIEFPWPVAEFILQHHERPDGSGYPNGLRGDQISLGSRILAVADVVEAMTHFRPYRPGLGIDTALAEIREHRGIRFDPDVVDSCLAVFAEGVIHWTSEHGGPR